MKTQFIILQRKNQIDFSENISNQRINQNEFVIECLFIFSDYLLLFGPRREKICFRWFANNKDAGQPAHTHSLISVFVIRVLGSNMSKLVTSEILI